MLALPTDSNMQSLQSDYPFPIAFVFSEAVINAPDYERCLRGIIQTFTTGIHYTAMIYASEYARANYQDERVSWSLERLKRPLISDFFHFITTADASLREHGISPLVTEGKAFGEEMEQTRVVVPKMVDDSPREQMFLLSKALMEMRNILGHKLYQANWALLVEQYLPHLLLFLRALEWSRRYPLLRVVGDGQMTRLMGATISDTSEPIPEAVREELARSQAAKEFSVLLLADATLTRFLNLYPLVILAPCEECQAEQSSGLTKEVFLFNGDEGKNLTYLGVRHSRNTEIVRDAIDALYESKKIQPPVIRVNQITPPELSRRASRHSKQLLKINISARRYLSQVYYRRPEIEAALHGFMRGNRAGFCLLGEAGIGKTSLLCRKVEEWSGSGAKMDDAEDAAATGDIVLFYAGKGLFASGFLEERIMNDLNLEGSFQELLNRLRPVGRRLIIIVDGINEDAEPHDTLRAVCQFITRHARAANTKAQTHTTLKFIFSFRTTFYHKTLRALGYADDGDEMRDLLPPDVFFTHEVEQQGQKKQTYRFVLDRMSVEEAEVVYEAYRAFEGVLDKTTRKARRFSPSASYGSLSLPTRYLITHPWYLRMVMEAFDGRPVPSSLWVGELLQEFCQTKIYGKTKQQPELFSDRTTFVDGLVHLMRDKHTDVIERDDPLLSPQMQSAIKEHQTPLSPYLQLLDEGVLMEMSESKTIGSVTRTRYLIRFAFDPLFEYLLSQDILLIADGWENLTSAHLASLLTEGKDFAHLSGAVELLLIEAAQKGQFGLLTETLNETELPIPFDVFTPVLKTLEGVKHRHFELLLDFMVEHGEPERALVMLWVASGEFGNQKLRPMLACAERAEIIGRRLIALGDDGIRSLLAMILINKSVALAGLGRLHKAVDSLDEVIEIYQALFKEQGRIGVAIALAMALQNKAGALRHLGSLDEALKCCREAITIFSELKNPELFHKKQLGITLNTAGLVLDELGTSSQAITVFDAALNIYVELITKQRQTGLEHHFAQTLMNKGLAQRQLGHLNEALNCANHAINIYRELITEQGRTELSNDLALALINKCAALLKLNRIEESIKSYDEAINIYRALIKEHGQTELDNRLAMTLSGKSEGLRKLRRLDEALKCGKEANEIYRGLVNQGRTELANVLAMSLINTGLILEDAGHLSEAILSYNEAIDLWSQLVERGMPHLTSNLLKGLRIRLYVWINLKRWDMIAADVQSFLHYSKPFQQTPSPPAPMVQEWSYFLERLRQLTLDERAQLYAVLDKFAETVFMLIEGNDKS
jgi:tetratricopeptide (TPR) repeat protein